MERTTIEDVNDARLFAAPIPASAGLIINPPPIPTIEPIIVENKPISFSPLLYWGNLNLLTIHEPNTNLF